MKKPNKKMQPKKGFTLVELLGVISILAIIIGVSVATFMNVKSNVLKKEYENVRSVIETKAANYARETGITTVSVGKLIEVGLLEPDDETDIYNPIDNTSMNCYVLKSEFKDDDYEASFIKEEVKTDKDYICTEYEITTDFIICALDGSGNCNKIDSNKWFKGAVTLGVTYRNGSKINDPTAQYEWTSNTGNTGYESTITTNASTVAQSTYKVKVVLADKIGEATEQIRIDNQAPVITNIDVEDTWAVKKRVEVTASDYTGSGVDGIYVGNKNDCSMVSDVEYVTATGGKATVERENGDFHVCVVDKVGNVSDEIKDVKVDKVDNNGADSMSLTPNPAGWAQKIELIGKAQDTKSGLVAYQFTTSSSTPTTWVNIEKTNLEITQRKPDISANGTYYFWVKDAVGNVDKRSYTIDKIDSEGAESISLTPNTYSYAKSITLTGRATDSKSGIVKYQITTSSSKPTSGWTTVSARKTVTDTKTVTSNGTYYFWVEDAVGNVSKASYNITMIDNDPPVCSGGSIYLGGGTRPSCTDVTTISYYYYVSTSPYQPAEWQITSTSPYFNYTCGNYYYMWVKAVDSLGNYTIMSLGYIYSGDCCNPRVYTGYTECGPRGWEETEIYNECTRQSDWERTGRACEYDVGCDPSWGECESNGRQYRWCDYYYAGRLESDEVSRRCTYTGGGGGGDEYDPPMGGGGGRTEAERGDLSYGNCYASNRCSSMGYSSQIEDCIYDLNIAGTSCTAAKPYYCHCIPHWGVLSNDTWWYYCPDKTTIPHKEGNTWYCD